MRRVHACCGGYKSCSELLVLGQPSYLKALHRTDLFIVSFQTVFLSSGFTRFNRPSVIQSSGGTVWEPRTDEPHIERAKVQDHKRQRQSPASPKCLFITKVSSIIIVENHIHCDNILEITTLFGFLNN